MRGMKENVNKLKEIRAKYLIKILKKELKLWLKKRRIVKSRFKIRGDYSAKIRQIVKI